MIKIWIYKAIPQELYISDLLRLGGIKALLDAPVFLSKPGLFAVIEPSIYKLDLYLNNARSEGKPYLWMR